MMASTAAMPSGVTTRCVWPGPSQSVTELMPFMNFSVHPHTCCSDRHVSPYWTVIGRWISMGFTPSLCTLFFFGVCSKRGGRLYTATTPSCCIPAPYCHLSSTLQTMSNTVTNLQENRVGFRIFIALFKVFIWTSLVFKRSFLQNSADTQAILNEIARRFLQSLHKESITIPQLRQKHPHSKLVSIQNCGNFWAHFALCIPQMKVEVNWTVFCTQK
jgi:hypothetical protein